MLVRVDNDIALAGSDGHGNDFLFKRAIGNRALCPAQRFNRICVLRPARQLIIVGGVLRERAHSAASFIRIFKAIEEHVVISRIMADARAAAMFFQQIGRVRHAFHATGDDIINRTSGQRFAAHDDGLHA